MSKSIITVGLGFGDEGKGTITDVLVRKYSSYLVIRYCGGAQAAHNVIDERGIHHTFAQFGSGSLAGANTYLSKHVLVNPRTLMMEAETLQPKVSHSVFDRLFIDERALVITPYHRSLNCLKEISRGTNKHGSCGMGIGTTASYEERYPNEGLRIKDLKNRKDLIHKLSLIRKRLSSAIRELKIPHTTLADEQFLIFDYDVETIADQYDDFNRQVNVINKDEAARIYKQANHVVFEGAQGILLDENYGFHPYTTWSTTTVKNAKEILHEFADFDKPEVIGIIRAYMTRHGAGPLPTESKDLNSLPEPHNVTNEWQSTFRKGWLDLPLLKYAITVNGGIDSLALTHVDYLDKLSEWKICSSYRRFTGDYGSYEVEPKYPLNQATQETNTRFLAEVKEYDECYYHPHINMLGNLEAEFCHRISTELGVPISIISKGPKASDKIFHQIEAFVVATVS